MQITNESISIPDSGPAPRQPVRAGVYSVQGARRDRTEHSQYVPPGMDLFVVSAGTCGHAAGEVISTFAHALLESLQ